MAQIERTKNTARNLIFGTMLTMLQIFVPFVMRTVIIYILGVQYVGLDSLFYSILSVLNLAELGVGTAMVFSMYRPIAEDDTVTICALMKLYRTYYRVIGLVIAVVGAVLTPFVPKLITGDVPTDINVYTLYLIYLGATVMSYWLFAYKSSILQAYQRYDVISKVLLVTTCLQYAVQFLVIWLFKNYYFYVLALLGAQVLTNIFTAICADRLYPQYKARGGLPRLEVSVINGRIRDLVTAKIGDVIVGSSDAIVISAFLGLTQLAIYQNYYAVILAIISIEMILFKASLAGIGNSLVVETKEKNYNDLCIFTLIVCWITGVCSCCLLNLFQPFMELWVGRELMVEFPVVICLVIYFYLFIFNQLLQTYKDSGGIWHTDRFRSLITATTNLVLNLIMVQFWGLYGIILSTVLSMLVVGIPWLIQNLFTTMFEKKMLLPYLKKAVVYVIAGVLACGATYYICSFVNVGLIPTLIIRLIVCAVVSNLIFLVIYFRMSDFWGALGFLNSMLHGKLNWLLSKKNRVK